MTKPSESPQGPRISCQASENEIIRAYLERADADANKDVRAITLISLQCGHWCSTWKAQTGFGLMWSGIAKRAPATFPFFQA
jgi:hypothetical protein